MPESNDNKIYVVTTGKYSDYTINRVFRSKKKAELYKSLIENASEVNDIEEYDFYDDRLETEVIPMHYVEVQFNLLTENMKIDLMLSNEKDSYHMHKTHLGVYSDGTMTNVLMIYRKTEETNLDVLRDKYLKVCRDIKAYIINEIEVNHATVFDLQRAVHNM